MRTRGERNNNPMNLRKSDAHWHGKVDGSDKEFETFDTAVNGIRAGAKVLMTYFHKYKLDTIRKIIFRFAPPVENDTDAYIWDVMQRMDKQADDVLDLRYENVMVSLVLAIISHENGQLSYSLETVQEGVRKAMKP